MLSSEKVKRIKNRKRESYMLGLMTIRDILKSARSHKHTLPHPHPLCNTYLKENDQVSAILPVINWGRINGNVLTNSGTLRFGDVLTYTDKADPEVHHCREFDFVTLGQNIRISPIGESWFRLRGEDLYTHFHFQKQAGIHGRQQT